MPEKFPFTGKTKAITYLGIQLPARLDELYSLNFTPLLSLIKDDLQKWDNPPFSWFGRAAILKMNILPKLLYIMQAIPIHLPPTFFFIYKTICTKFLWHKCPHIKYEHLMLPRTKGGIGLPDIQNYHKACLLTRIVDWNIHATTKQWVTLEESISSLPLATTPWLLPKHIPSTISNHLLTHRSYTTVLSCN